MEGSAGAALAEVRAEAGAVAVGAGEDGRVVESEKSDRRLQGGMHGVHYGTERVKEVGEAASAGVSLRRLNA